MRILLLEDSATDASLMEYELRKAKLTYTLKQVQTEEAFVAALDHFKPHLIIGDHRLPSYDGLKALVYVQENHSEIPFIFISGVVGEDKAIESLKLGAKDYILKDRLTRLVPAMQRALREVENYREQREVFQKFVNLANFPSENPNPVLRIARDGKILFANQSSSQLLQFWGCEIGQQLADDPKKFALECLASGLKKEIEVICDNIVYSLMLHPINERNYLNVYGTDITERKQVEARLARLNVCFLGFGNNFDANIQQLVEVGGNLLGGTCALYNRLQGDKLFSVGQWQTPADYQALDVAKGHVCFDVICKRADNPLVVRNLQASHYAQTDPNVRRYNLETYIGAVVHCQQVAVGSMCVVYQADIEPAPNDLLFLGIIAAAIGVEEERKQAKEELQRLRRQQELILNSTWEGIIALDLTGNHTFVNPTAARMLGYEVGELLGRHSHLVWHHSKADGTPASEEECPVYAALRKSEAYHGRKEIFWRKDGTSFPAECSFAPLLENGEVKGGVVTFKDVSEQSEAEELSRNLMSWSPVGIYILADKKFKFVNHWFQNTIGYNEKELLNFNFWNLVHPEDREAVRANTLKMLRGKTSIPYKYRVIAKGGKIKWIMETVVKIQYMGKTATLGSFIDITEQKQLEDHFRHAQKMEAVGRLARGVAHDFNNMLTVVRWYSDSIINKTKAGNPIHGHAKGILQAATRAIALTNQLLAFSRKQVMELQVLDLNVVIKDMEPMLRSLIGEDIAIAMVLDPELWAIKADSAQMGQVIMNLAINAQDAMPRGGNLTIETENVYLNAANANKHLEVVPGNYVLLVASDNGIGMDAETRSHLFEPFFTTKKDEKGTGLGLAMVYGIVKQSGGYIWVDSEPGQGTTFKVYFPRVEGTVKPLRERKAPTKVLQGLETILVVEDEDMLRDLICETLGMHRYKVLEARDGSEALRAGEQHEKPLDLLLSDVVLPKMGGRELAERLSRSHPEMRVIFMSGYTENAIVHHGVLDPDINFIHKPFTVIELLRKVREVLAG